MVAAGYISEMLSGDSYGGQGHPSKVGGSRSTVWEIHPILHIESQRDDGGWDEL